MTLLVDHIRIARRFQRSIRIDTDFGDARALEGFVCPESSGQILSTMARHVIESGQGAFTWTGPYGSGKSSLVVALSALLNGNKALQQNAEKVFGRVLAKAIWDAFPTGARGWKIIPVVGRRDDAVNVLGEAIEAAGLIDRKPRGGWTEKNLIETLADVLRRITRNHGGLLLFVDEMGKFLEGAAHEGKDLYIFQQLAEMASRSKGRFIIVGVLHQSFEEYVHRLSRDMRDEWAKIQGRFIDLAVSSAPEEQIDLISRAIESDHSFKKPSSSSQLIARIVCGDRTADREQMGRVLESCWPLHPVVAALLGPISRRRFGQNQRSIFGFLNSSEPHGFQDFIHSASDDQIYTADKLWDYLRANLEPSILASPDGHRWALAAEALERCESTGGDALHLRLLKTIAVIDLFKERSGLVASDELLRMCFPEVSENSFKGALLKLRQWSLIIFKKFLDANAIFAGSDFDIEEAVRLELDEIHETDFGVLKTLADLQPILAKRHYHETGCLRWFDVALAPLKDLVSTESHYRSDNGTIGQFLLAIPTEGETEEQAAECCREAIRQAQEWDVVVGLSQRSWAVVILARELLALERVRNDRPELAGDPVARREVSARIAALQAQLESEMQSAFDSAVWYRKWQRMPKTIRRAELNSLASELAERRFSQCPRLHNELLNRQKPSSSAIAAQNELLRRMVLNEGEERLGIEGFPAEGGLLASILESSGLYAVRDGMWRFVAPSASEGDPCRLSPIWDAAIDYIKLHSTRTVSLSEIYGLWRRHPYGVKDGLMPVIAVAFVLSQWDSLAIYREGIFRARFDDVDVDYLAKDPTMIQFRWMDLSEVARKLLSGMAEIVRKLDRGNTLVHLEPIDVARGLVGIYEQLPEWTKRTMRLSSNALRVRDLFKRARDPNKFLFDDIPALLGENARLTKDDDLQKVVAGVGEGLDELVQAYPSMLGRMEQIMLAELQVPNGSPQALADLRARAGNIRQLAGDFHLEAFVGRLSQFDGNEVAFEGIASLAASKPPRDWVDLDLDRAAVDVAEMAQKFLRAETFARVKGRPDKRQAVAVVIGMQGRPEPIVEEFAVADSDRMLIDELITRLGAALERSDTKRRSIILAALAELSVRYMQREVSAADHGNGRALS
jgi:Family of unknown function (DUF6079)